MLCLDDIRGILRDRLKVIDSSSMASGRDDEKEEVRWESIDDEMDNK
jgi:hypothetical protein